MFLTCGKNMYAAKSMKIIALSQSIISMLSTLYAINGTEGIATNAINIKNFPIPPQKVLLAKNFAMLFLNADDLKRKKKKVDPTSMLIARIIAVVSSIIYPLVSLQDPLLLPL